MTISKSTARITGFLYLLIAIGAGFGYGFVHGSIVVPEDPTATMRNLMESQTLFQFSILAGIFAFVCDIAVATLFYIMLRPVSLSVSLMATLFRVTQTAVLGANTLLLIVVSLLVYGPDGAESSASLPVETMALLLLSAHDMGYDVAMIFFGVHCLLLGWLLFRAEYFPGWLGVILVAAGCAYLIDSTTSLLQSFLAVYTDYLVVVTAIVAELALVFYLLIRGLNEKALPRSAD